MIPERQAALRVIEALNRAAHGAARLEPYLWEENIHRSQGARSYQGNIPLPAEFDIFLGFLFSPRALKIYTAARLCHRQTRQGATANLLPGPEFR